MSTDTEKKVLPEYANRHNDQTQNVSSGDLDEKSMEMVQNEETPPERRSRMRSIVLANASACIMLIGFTVISPGMYPYMKQVSRFYSSTLYLNATSPI